MATNNHTIHPGLIKAYRNTNYTVDDTGTLFVLNIGVASKALVSIMALHGVTTAAFLTAFNPYSEVMGPEMNAANQTQLEVDVIALENAFLKGYGQDPKGLWPKEDSILALGITESQAEFLADKYHQNGFVWINSQDGFCALRLRLPIAIPDCTQIDEWVGALPPEFASAARKLPPVEQAWLMTTEDHEQHHWLNPAQWDLNQPWPLAKPDGSSMGVGTELDRIFKIIAAGQRAM